MKLKIHFGLIKSLYKGFNRDPHVAGMILITILIGTIITKNVFPLLFDETVFYVVLGITYLLYLVESFVSETYDFISSKAKILNSSVYIETLINSNIHIEEKVKCYHKETQTKLISTTNDKGNTKYSTETHEIEVITHEHSITFPYTQCIDTSDVIYRPDENFSMLTCYKTWQCSDDYTSIFYQNYINTFHRNHEYCDQLRQFDSVFTIEGFYEHVIICSDIDEVPFFIRYGYILYIFITLCGGSWLYRLWLVGYCLKQTWHITKIIRCDPQDSRCVLPAPTLPVSSTCPHTHICTDNHQVSYNPTYVTPNNIPMNVQIYPTHDIYPTSNNNTNIRAQNNRYTNIPSTTPIQVIATPVSDVSYTAGSYQYADAIHSNNTTTTVTPMYGNIGNASYQQDLPPKYVNYPYNNNNNNNNNNTTSVINNSKSNTEYNNNYYDNMNNSNNNMPSAPPLMNDSYNNTRYT